MRRHHTSLFSWINNYHLSTIHNENDRVMITRRQELRGKSAYSFRSTDFDKCETSGTADGGAIYCTTGSLAIEECIFTNCKSSNRSGSVFFQCTYVCNDTNNLFVNSSSDLHTGTFDDWSATKSIHSQSIYINSHAEGIFGIMNIEGTSDATVSTCIFINGSAESCCGLLTLTKISGLASICNCIFAKGVAKSYGGAFGTLEPYSGNPRPSFYFCYFSNNYCSDKTRGADFDADGTTGQYYLHERIVHCFSSSRGVRVYIEGRTATAVSNWLPHGRLALLVDGFPDSSSEPATTN